MDATLVSLGLIAAAVLFGSMLFFSAIVAPVAFVSLDAPNAGLFVRRLFPWYYLAICVLAFGAALVLAAARPLEAAVMAAVAAGGMIARQVLMPRINRYRDRSLAGDDQAGRRFDILHRASVWLNAGQLLAVLAVLVLLARASV